MNTPPIVSADEREAAPPYTWWIWNDEPQPDG
jgi:hypothetical protein